MTKRILIGLFILLMVAVSIIAYNFYKNVKQPLNPTSLEAVPQHAAIIIKEENFAALLQKINSTNMVWELLVDSTQTAQKLNKEFKWIDTLLQTSFKSFVTSKQAMASLHLSGANSYDFIYYFPLPGEDFEEGVIQQLKAVSKANPSKRSYDGANIYSFPIGDEKWAVSLYQGTLAFSKSTVLIEDVIRELNSPGNLLADTDFKKVMNSSGQAEDGNLFVNNKHFSKVMSQFLNKEFKDYFQGFEQYAGWTELDLSIKPNSVALNGFSFADDSQFINLFKNQKAQDIGIFEYTPYNTAYLFQYGLSDVKAFFNQRKNLLKASNQFFNYQKYLDQLTSAYGIDLEVELLGHIDQEIAFVITESLNEQFYDNKFVIYKVKEEEKALIDLKKIAQNTGAGNDTTSVYGHYVGKLNVKNLFPKLLGKPFINLTNHYFTLIDGYVVFANSPKALEKFATDIEHEKTLANDENFDQFEDNLASSSNCFIYNNVARSINLYKVICSEDILPIIDQKTSTIRKFEALSFQMTTEKNKLFYNNLYLKYNPVYKQETGSLWELSLDTISTNAPQLVKNHNTNTLEIVVQDNANKLYLISSTGKVLWTKQLQEKIMGKVHQIDVYKNNKLQLLFNTASKLYLIDRNGNNVEQFPVKLPAKATMGVSPMDYDKNRNYRLLIGCIDNMVYNYDATGLSVKGWEYSSTNSPARDNIWHFAINGKDYITIPLSNGQVNVVERSGKTRIKLNNMLPTGNKIYLKVGSSLAKSYLVTADTNATVVKLYFNDTKEALKFDDVQSGAKFSWVDFNGDKQKDFSFNWNSELKIFDTEKKLLYKTELSSPLKSSVTSFSMEQQLTGFTTNGKVYLLDTKGMVLDGFPLKGSTAFELDDINKDNISNLVVIDQKTLYLYNLK